MASNVNIALKPTGVADALNALKGVKQSLIDLEKSSLDATKDASKARLSILKAEYSERESLAKRAMAVEARLGRGFGQSPTGATRPASMGAGAFGAYGSVSRFGAQQFGFGGVSTLFSKGGMEAAALGVGFMALGGALAMATTALKAFGNFVLHDVVQPGLHLETRSTQLANRTHETTPAAIQRAARLNSIRYNMSYEQSLGVIEEYGARGGQHSWRDAPQVSEFVAKYSKATGYDPTKIASLLGGIRKPGESSDDVVNKFLAIEPAMGINIDPEHMAGLGRRAKTVGSLFAGSSIKQMSEANALLQVASTGTGSPEQAATGMSQFFRKIISDPKVHGHFKKFLTMENGQEVIKDPFELLRFIASKEHGKMTNLSGLGIKDTRAAMQFLRPLEGGLSGFREQAGKEGLSGKDAEKRALDLWIESLKEGMKNVKEMSDIDKDAAAVMQTTGEQWERAMNQMKDAILTDVMPHVQKFAHVFTDNIDDITSKAVTLTGALVGLIEVIVDIVNGYNKVRNTMSNAGSVVGFAVDRGDKTNFNTPTGVTGGDIEGYWRKGKSGLYEYVKGKAGHWETDADGNNKFIDGIPGISTGKTELDKDKNSIIFHNKPEDGSWKNIGPNGTKVWVPGDSSTATPGVTTLDPVNVEGTKGGVDTSSVTPGANASSAPTGGSSSVKSNVDFSELIKGSSDAGQALLNLSKQVQDLTNNMSKLNRSKSFVEK